VRAELEVAQADKSSPPVERLLDDLREALQLLGDVEAAALGVMRVLVVDDDERLGELTARGLRRLGYDAEATTQMRTLRPREIVVFDLSVSSTLGESEREMLRTARPIVLTGAVDSASRALADDLEASDYLVKPVEVEVLAAAVNRRKEEGRP
jgi:DNA-binding response OmpR family regulator